MSTCNSPIIRLIISKFRKTPSKNADGIFVIPLQISFSILLPYPQKPSKKYHVIEFLFFISFFILPSLPIFFSNEHWFFLPRCHSRCRLRLGRTFLWPLRLWLSRFSACRRPWEGPQRPWPFLARWCLDLCSRPSIGNLWGSGSRKCSPCTAGQPETVKVLVRPLHPGCTVCYN